MKKRNGGSPLLNNIGVKFYSTYGGGECLALESAMAQSSVGKIDSCQKLKDLKRETGINVQLANISTSGSKSYLVERNKQPVGFMEVDDNTATMAVILLAWYLALSKSRVVCRNCNSKNCPGKIFE